MQTRAVSDFQEPLNNKKRLDADEVNKWNHMSLCMGDWTRLIARFATSVQWIGFDAVGGPMTIGVGHCEADCIERFLCLHGSMDEFVRA